MALPFYVSPEQFMKDKYDYARKGVARGRSVLALNYVDGIMFIAENPSVTLHKIAEIYDRIAFAGVGKINEFEALKVLGIRQADIRGFSYSRHDVSARGLANSYSQTLGEIFTNQIKPWEVEILVAQVGDDSAGNELYHIVYDGGVSDEDNFVAMGGKAETLRSFLNENFKESDLSETLKFGVRALTEAEGYQPDPKQLEVAVLDRTRDRRKFRRLNVSEIGGHLEGVTFTPSVPATDTGPPTT